MALVNRHILQWSTNLSLSQENENVILPLGKRIKEKTNVIEESNIWMQEVILDQLGIPDQ